MPRDVVEVLAHECDVERAMAYTSRALEVVDLKLKRRFDILATCPDGWDARQVTVGFPRAVRWQTAATVVSMIARSLQGWQLSYWQIGAEPRPKPDDIPYRYTSSASGGAFIDFVVDWLPDA